MAARKKSVAPSTRRKAAPGRRPADRIVVGAELLRSSFDVMTELGLTDEEQQEALVRAQKSRRDSGASKQMLERSHALGDLLSHWQKNRPFVDARENPKVLPIRGRGATLETLARRFVPGMRLTEVVKAITRYSEVRRIKRNKVALVGTILMLIPKTPDLTLAAVTLGFQRLSRTVVHNSRHSQERGHFQRYAASRMTAREFSEWLERAKPRLQQQLVETETGMTRGSKSGRGKDTGVALFIFRDE